MPYQNTLFLANLESLKDSRIKLSQSFFKKLLSTNSYLHTLLPPERNNGVLSKLHKTLRYPVPYSRTKRCQPFLNYALAHFQSKPANELVCFILFMLWTVYYVMCILYRVLYCNICLYCSFYVVYVLPIQLLGCHDYNKRLSCYWFVVVVVVLCFVLPTFVGEKRFVKLCDNGG